MSKDAGPSDDSNGQIIGTDPQTTKTTTDFTRTEPGNHYNLRSKDKK